MGRSSHEAAHPSLLASHLWVWSCYIVAFGVAVAACYPIHAHTSTDPVYVCAIGDAIATFIVFVFSAAFGNSSFYDAYWSVFPPFACLYWFLSAEYKQGSRAADVPPTRSVLLLVAVFLWSIRLTGNWAIGWTGLSHEDWRYIKLRQDMLGEGQSNTQQNTAAVNDTPQRRRHPIFYWIFGSFLGLHTFPTVVVFVGLLPAYVALYLGGNDFQALDIIGPLVSLIGTLFELVSDTQMRRWQQRQRDKNEDQRDEYIDVGLWRYSRHPNYFGELLFWLGLFLTGINAGDPAKYWWTCFGVVIISVMFVFASIPMMEERQLKRRPGYAQYRQQVSMLIPWFRARPKQPLSQQ